MSTEPKPESPAELAAVTDAMIDAYLQANDAYWRKTDELPKPPDRWRTGNVREATRVSLLAALAIIQASASASQEPVADDEPLSTLRRAMQTLCDNIKSRQGAEQVREGIQRAMFDLQSVHMGLAAASRCKLCGWPRGHDYGCPNDPLNPASATQARPASGEAVRRLVLSADLYELLMNIQNGIRTFADESMANSCIRQVDAARREITAPTSTPSAACPKCHVHPDSAMAKWTACVREDCPSAAKKD